VLLSLSVGQEVSEVSLDGCGLTDIILFSFCGQLRLFSVEVNSSLLLGFLGVPFSQLLGEKFVELGQVVSVVS